MYMTADNTEQILSDLKTRLRGVSGVLSVGLRHGPEGEYLLLKARPGSPALSLPRSYRGLPLEKELV